MDFFGSPLGVAIAWICTVASFFYSVLVSSKNKKLKMDVALKQEANQALSHQINELRARSVDLSANDVSQNGEKNLYIKQQSGGMKINM